MNRMGDFNAMKYDPCKENVFLSQIAVNVFGANSNEPFPSQSVLIVFFMEAIIIGNKLCFGVTFWLCR